MSVFFPENNSDSYFSTGTYFSAFALVNDLFYDLVNDLVMTFYDLYDLVNDLIMTFYDLFYLKWLWDEFVLKPGVDISENFPGTRYPSVPKFFFLAGTQYASVPKILVSNILVPNIFHYFAKMTQKKSFLKFRKYESLPWWNKRSFNKKSVLAFCTSNEMSLRNFDQKFLINFINKDPR